LKKIFGYLRLSRPANIVTAIADVLAGIAISGLFLSLLGKENYIDIILLCLSTIGLYGGGIVFNDVFDVELDRIERPERTIPSGLISLKEAASWGAFLLIFGIAMAFFVNQTAGFLAILISASALIYDKWGKHHRFLGPPNMGLCRGLNLLLGISILPSCVWEFWHIALAPVLYISAITMISRGEVHGSKRKPLYAAAILYGLVILFILWFSWINGMTMIVIPFLLGFTIMIFRPLRAAITSPTGPLIGKAVKAGVIALILMNASWAAASGTWIVAIVIVLLLPLSIWLSRKFAVT
jgi:4-hydroxybenzoate polyprenyltransferase